MKSLFVAAIGATLVLSSCNLQQLPQASTKSISDLGIQTRSASSAELQLAVRLTRSTNEVIDWSRAITVTQPNGQTNIVASTRSGRLIGITVGGEGIGQITFLSATNNTANFSDAKGNSTRTISFDNTGRVLSDTATEDPSEPLIYIAATCGELQDRIYDLNDEWNFQLTATAVAAAAGIAGLLETFGVSAVLGFGGAALMAIEGDRTMKKLSNARKDFHANCVYDPNRDEPRY